VDPRRAVALEDAAAGIRAARAAGLRCIAVGPVPAYRAVDATGYLPSVEGQTLASLSALVARGEEESR
jgi:beta-phosphoglucomutase-like phosphatase (HAD superfamily)